MALFKSSNPTLALDTFDKKQAGVGQAAMTLQGTVNKSAILLVLVFGTAMYSWNLVLTATNTSLLLPVAYGGGIAGLVIALILTFKQEWAPFLAPLYAICKGLFLGVISASYNAMFPGIAIQALMLTMSIFSVLLLIYKFKIIQATENFKLIVSSATIGIMLCYLVTFVLSFFGVQVPMIHSSGMIGIGFSLFVVAIASLNLVMDFDFIERGAENNAPKYMEWYGAFGLIVTIIWMYVEILRLLSKLRD
jgi:uncharacterized YccA/Bax inhibitor family protein